MHESPSRSALCCAVGQSIYGAGMAGAAWRVARGVVRLDAVDEAGRTAFASLAVAGDIIGCEAMLLGSYTFSAAALTECELEPWPEGIPSGPSLMHSLAQAQRRAAELVALRGGEAIHRVVRLVRLLSDPGGNVVLPMRQDIADITDLRFETISRIMKKLVGHQVLTPHRIAGVHATRSFKFRDQSKLA